MAKQKISIKDLDKLVKKYSDKMPDSKSITVARRIEQDYETGYSPKYIADKIGQCRGTAKSHKQLAEKPAEAKQGTLVGNQNGAKYDREEIEKVVAKYVADHQNVPSSQVARNILKDRPELPYHIEHLSYLVRNYKKRNKIETIIKVAPAEGGERYHVIDGTYKWECKRGPLSIPVELADQMFYEYSKHGLDMSQSQMRGKHDLKIWEWNTIKSTMFLYKDANIMSPWTEENTPKEDLERIIAERMEFKTKDKQRLVETAYNKETIKKYKQVIDKDQRATFAVENMLDELNDIMAEWKTKTAAVRRTDDFKTERKWLVVPIADIHIGSRVEGLKLTPEFNSDQCRHLLDQVAKRINAQKATDVTLVIMGDIIESFTGLNHKNSWQNVEYGMVYAKVIKEAMSILEEFIAKVDNVREILGISGNHDRVTSDNKEDRTGAVAEIIFYMLQRLYGSVMNVEYEGLVLAKQIDGIQYIFTHNDKRVVREGKQAILDHGDSKLFNMIIGAHVHNRKVIEDERTFRWVIVPAIFTGNRYSEENAWHARAGFDTFENDGQGRPIQTGHTIH